MCSEELRMLCAPLFTHFAILKWTAIHQIARVQISIDCNNSCRDGGLTELYISSTLTETQLLVLSVILTHVCAPIFVETIRYINDFYCLCWKELESPTTIVPLFDSMSVKEHTTNTNVHFSFTVALYQHVDTACWYNVTVRHYYCLNLCLSELSHT